MQLISSKQLITILSILVALGVAVFFFWNDINSILGISNVYQTPIKDYKGVSISFVAGTRTVAIPPKFSDDVLNYIKQEMTETGGMPLKIERKGNVLPFGIP
ncbi:MAG: hypothetical protein V1690_00085 [Candidatus Moraniibacteriota bacterium]